MGYGVLLDICFTIGIFMDRNQEYVSETQFKIFSFDFMDKNQC